MQRRGGLFSGIFLLTLGVLFLARRAGWLDVDWHVFVDLWPLLLILAGLNLILIRRDNPLAFVTTVMLAVTLSATFFGVFNKQRSHNRYDWRWHRDRDKDDDDDDYRADSGKDSDENNSDDNEESYHAERERKGIVGAHTNTFSEAMSANTREAVLKLSGGAGRFVIGEPTSELIKANTKHTVGSYSMTVERDPTSNNPTIELKPTEENQRLNWKDGKFENNVDVHLNTTPIWTMSIALGAGQGDLDLSQYAVKNLRIEAGAADVDVKLGAKADEADVKLDVGAASVTIRVPKEVGCRIKKDGALNIEQLDDFNSVGGGEFVSPGYDNASKKMTIRFDGGVSRFKVVRY